VTGRGEEPNYRGGGHQHPDISLQLNFPTINQKGKDLEIHGTEGIEKLGWLPARVAIQFIKEPQGPRTKVGSRIGRHRKVERGGNSS